MSNGIRIPSPLPLLVSLASIALFPVGISVMERTQAWLPALGVALPAVTLACLGIVLGVRILKRRPSGNTYGFAMVGSLAGGFSMIFWSIMVPMLLLIAYPARQKDTPDPVLAQSEKQMLILVRHLKTFNREYDRLPVRLEELVDKGYIQPHLLYDPRQKRRDAPSYRLMVHELPPEQAWDTVPILEGRIPDADGHRLCAYANETTGTLPPLSPP